MAFVSPSGENLLSQVGQIPAKCPLDSENRTERYSGSKATSRGLAAGENLKGSPASSIFTEPFTEHTSRQQQTLGNLQTGPPTRGAASGALGANIQHADHTFPLHYCNANSGNPASQTHEHKAIVNGCDECFICKKYVRQVSYALSCPICSRILHLPCVEKRPGVELSLERLETMEDWCCPACYQDPLQNTSEQSKDKSRHPRSKRTFKEMHESTTYDDDTDSQTIIADDDQ